MPTMSWCARSASVISRSRLLTLAVAGGVVMDMGTVARRTVSCSDE
jgi:hypothetical protein